MGASITNRELNAVESALALLSLYYSGFNAEEIDLTQINYYTMKSAIQRTADELDQLWREKQEANRAKR